MTHDKPLLPNNGSSGLAASQLSALQTSPLPLLFDQAKWASLDGDWSSVIGMCDVAIAQCQQYLQMEQEQSQGFIQVNALPSPQSISSSRQNLDRNNDDPDDDPDKNIDSKAKALRYQTDGDRLQKDGQIEAAIHAYEQALGYDPNRTAIKLKLAETYLQLGNILKGQSSPKDAARAYLKALHYSPKLFDAYSQLRYNLMRYHIPPKDPVLTEIVTTCQHIIEQHPELTFAHTTLGYALTKLGHVSAATECYHKISTKVSSLQPVDPRFWETAQRHPPKFIIIGAEKCGTTSLYNYLSQHPKILSPVEKEIDFFDDEYHCGLDWYLAHFPPLSSQFAWVTGEVSPNYLYSDVAPQRIAHCSPDAKLIVILRNPIDRTVSRYNMLSRNQVESRRFSEVIAQELQSLHRATWDNEIPWSTLNQCRYIGNSLYYFHLKRWLDIFPRHQLLILKSEDLFQKPEQVLHRIFTDLGLEHHQNDVYSKYNSGNYEQVSPELSQILLDFFTPHTRKLESLLNMTFEWGE